MSLQVEEECKGEVVKSKVKVAGINFPRCLHSRQPRSGERWVFKQCTLAKDHSGRHQYKTFASEVLQLRANLKGMTEDRDWNYARRMELEARLMSSVQVDDLKKKLDNLLHDALEYSCRKYVGKAQSLNDSRMRRARTEIRRALHRLLKEGF